jgi:hypothetical protein
VSAYLTLACPGQRQVDPKKIHPLEGGGWRCDGGRVTTVVAWQTMGVPEAATLPGLTALASEEGIWSHFPFTAPRKRRWVLPQALFSV